MVGSPAAKIVCTIAAQSITLLCATLPANAQSYPQRPVRVIVNVTAGGGTDQLARIVAQPAPSRPVWWDPGSGLRPLERAT